MALARDAKLLAERGWSIDSLEAFDLFPHTHHIEAVASAADVGRGPHGCPVARVLASDRGAEKRQVG